MKEYEGLIEWITPSIWGRKELKLQAIQARAILVQAKQDDVYEARIPDDADTMISEAERIVEMAQTAWAANTRGPAVEAILRLAAEEPRKELDDEITNMPVDKPWQGYDDEKVSSIKETLLMGLEASSEPDEFLAHVWEYESANKNRVRLLKFLNELMEERANNEEAKVKETDETQEAPGPIIEDIERSPDADAGSDAGPETLEQSEEKPPLVLVTTTENGEQPERERTESSDPSFEAIIREVEQEVNQERLHIPEPPSDPPPEVPYDYSKITPAELHSYHSIFSSYAYHINYKYMIAQRTATVLKMRADDLHNELLVKSDKYDEHNKEKRIALLEAEIEQDANIKQWRAHARRYEIIASSLRRERESYETLVESMSRLETLRHNEFLRSHR